MSTIQPPVIYTLDADDRLVSVGGAWKQEAQANHAPALAEPTLLHRSLWEFITDRETQIIYAMVFDQVRQTKQPRHLTIRCDTPTLRRRLQLRISPVEPDHLRISSRVVSQEVRPAVALLDITLSRNDQWLTVCSWCKQVELPAGRWAEVEEAVQALKLFEQRALPQITHGMCPACRLRFTRKLHPAKPQVGLTHGPEGMGSTR